MAGIFAGGDDGVDVLAHELANIGDGVGSDRSGGHEKFEKSHDDGKPGKARVAISANSE